MAMALVFFILTVLDVAIVFTAAFPSNVHKVMTLVEISETFGTKDGSVPDYQIFAITLPGTSRLQHVYDEINSTVEINGTKISLNLKPTDGHLASKYTPVWSAVTDSNAYENIRYFPLPNVIRYIGEFKMYQDLDNEAAIVVYTDHNNDSIVEGIVTSKYAIKSLPSRLSIDAMKARTSSFHETSVMGKRSIKPDANEASYFVLFETPPSSQAECRTTMYKRKEKRRYPLEKRAIFNRRGRRKPPTVVYPEILIVLDHNAIRNRSIRQALRFTLAFWNGVDMVYSAVDSPKIHLNIAGIIISADDAATPYLTASTAIKTNGNIELVVERIGKYFYKEPDRFPFDKYDVIIAMTTMKLCYYGVEPCEVVLGYASEIKAACSLETDMKWYKSIKGTGIVSYNSMFHGVDTAIHEIGHLLGAYHDEGEGITTKCNYTEGFAMTPTAEFNHQSFKWSPCSIKFFRYYFSFNETSCMDNEPPRIEPADSVLPGRWLSLNGQCKNSGFAKTCDYVPDFAICTIAGCEANGTRDCIMADFVPLAGSKCGVNKYCDRNYKCVSE